MKDKDTDLNQRIAQRVRELRAAQAMSLEDLAEKSGVSRSMISLIERGETSPTAVLLEKIAAGLGVMLGSFFETATPAMDRGPVARRANQSEWRDPASGYVRRHVSPSAPLQPMQIVEVQFPAGARVAFESGARATRVFQQVWMLDGTMEITVGSDRHLLDQGDCLAMQLDRPIMFHNPTTQPARYAVVIASATHSRR